MKENMIKLDYKQVMLLDDGTHLFVKTTPTNSDMVISGVKEGFKIVSDRVKLFMNDTYEYYIEGNNEINLIDKFAKYYKNSRISFMECVSEIYEYYLQQTGDDCEMWQMKDEYVNGCLDDLIRKGDK